MQSNNSFSTFWKTLFATPKEIKVELIPVIEVAYSFEGIKRPESYPYWENQDEWQEYSNKVLKKVGFEDELIPHHKGSDLYAPKHITDKNLKKIITDKTEIFRTEDFDKDDIYSLFGGFVLRVDNEDKYFPQCCGDLSDIKFWEKTANGMDSYIEGHPAPGITFGNDKIFFDFSIGKYDEHFQPTPPNTQLEVNISDLKLAFEKAKAELNLFAKRLIKINDEMGWGIEKIDDFLIWKNGNHE